MGTRTGRHGKLTGWGLLLQTLFNTKDGPLGVELRLLSRLD